MYSLVVLNPGLKHCVNSMCTIMLTVNSFLVYFIKWLQYCRNIFWMVYLNVDDTSVNSR